MIRVIRKVCVDCGLVRGALVAECGRCHSTVGATVRLHDQQSLVADYHAGFPARVAA